MPQVRGRRLANPLPLPKDTVLCGEIVLDPSQPYNDVVAYPEKLASGLKILPTPLTNVHDLHGAGIGFDFKVKLMSFLTAQAKAMRLGDVEIKVARGTIYKVRDSGGAFKKACGDQEVRDWIEEHVIDEGRNAAMIVGMHTYSDATYRRTGSRQVGAGASASDPTGSTNAEATARAGAVGFDHQTFNMPDEQIFAIEYRKVMFRRWSKKMLENARLHKGPNFWEIFLGDRSKGPATDDEENTLQCELEDHDGTVDGEHGDNKEDEEEEEEEEEAEGETGAEEDEDPELDSMEYKVTYEDTDS